MNILANIFRYPNLVQTLAEHLPLSDVKNIRRLSTTHRNIIDKEDILYHLIKRKKIKKAIVYTVNVDTISTDDDEARELMVKFASTCRYLKYGDLLKINTSQTYHSRFVMYISKDKYQVIPYGDESRFVSDIHFLIFPTRNHPTSLPFNYWDNIDAGSKVFSSQTCYGKKLSVLFKKMYTDNDDVKFLVDLHFENYYNEDNFNGRRIINNAVLRVQYLSKNELLLKEEYKSNFENKLVLMKHYRSDLVLGSLIERIRSDPENELCFHIYFWSDYKR